jgi:hypothetical protein
MMTSSSCSQQQEVITRVLKAIKDDVLLLLGHRIFRERCIETLTGTHGKLASSQLIREDGSI